MFSITFVICVHIVVIQVVITLMIGTKKRKDLVPSRQSFDGRPRTSHNTHTKYTRTRNLNCFTIKYSVIVTISWWQRLTMYLRMHSKQKQIIR